MSKRTREKKSAKPQQPAKPDEILVGRRFAQPCYAKARLLFDHPHSLPFPTLFLAEKMRSAGSWDARQKR
jgi:hypothetical protein